MTQPNLPAVPAYPGDYATGGGALAALHAALRSLGLTAGYEELLVLSGAAFSFVYDNAPVYEPQRDLFPLDVVRVGTRAAGFNGRWLVDRPAGETLEAIAAGLAAGRPALVPLYSVDEFHGTAVALGCAPREGRLLIQAGEKAYTPGMAPTVHTVQAGDGWWGAVTGPQAWGACPAFLPEPGTPSGWSPEGRLCRALSRGATLLTGGWIPYHDCEGSREFSNVPLAGRQAAYGLPAYDLLAADLGGAEWLGGFDLIWRLDAQVSQLHHYRRAAAAFLRTVAHPLATEAVEACTATARDAAELAARFWYRPSRELTAAADVMAMAGSQRAMLFWLGLPEEEQARLAQRMAVVETPWGPVAVRDSIPRRREAVSLVQRIRRQEEQLSQLLTQLALAL